MQSQDSIESVEEKNLDSLNLASGTEESEAEEEPG